MREGFWGDLVGTIFYVTFIFIVGLGSLYAYQNMSDDDKFLYIILLSTPQE